MHDSLLLVLICRFSQATEGVENNSTGQQPYIDLFTAETPSRLLPLSSPFFACCFVVCETVAPLLAFDTTLIQKHTEFLCRIGQNCTPHGQNCSLEHPQRRPLKHQGTCKRSLFSVLSNIQKLSAMKTSALSILGSVLLFAADGEAAPHSLRSSAATEIKKSKEHTHDESLTIVSSFKCLYIILELLLISDLRILLTLSS